MKATTVSETLIDDSILTFTSKQTLYLRHFRIDETGTGFLTSEGGGRPQSFTQAAPNEQKLGKGG